MAKKTGQEKIYFEFDGLISQVICNKETRGLIVEGETSLGKTFRIKKNLSKFGLIEGRDYEIHSGHTTTLRFYVKLYEKKDKIHVFDDESILHNKTNLNMIKAILNGNESGFVEYDTSKKLPDGIPNEFEFTGKIIILLNKMPSNDAHLKAVESRVLNYKLIIPYEDKINLLYDIAGKTEVEGTTKEDRIKIVDWIKENTDRSTQNLNIRLYEHCLYFFIQDRSTWKTLAKTQIKKDAYIELILQGITEKQFCEQTGKSRVTYYRIKRKLKNDTNDTK